MDAAQRRKLYPTTHREDIHIFAQGKKYINFSSNDYLNIGSDKTLTNAFLKQMYSSEEALFSSSSSRLLSGNSAPFTRLEQFLAGWYQKESALLFNSGYHANMGIISALMQKGDVIFSDKLNHNSIVAGMLHSGADFYRYRHLDCTHLEELLKKHRASHKNALIVSESVFSMDGDTADIAALIRLKETYGCLLLLDEAHGVGVLGKNGQGLCAEHENHMPKIDVIMAAMGKALGSQGAFCAASGAVIQMLVNKAPTFIFSTALAPMQVLWSEFILTQHFDRLMRQQEKLRTLINECGFSSHIVPHIVGESEDTVRMAQYLQEQGFFVLPVRPPTVPAHTARLRISLCADMEKHHIDGLFAAIETYRRLH